MSAVVERVDRLEQALADFTTSSVDDSVLRCVERNGFLVAAIGDQLLEL
jgi:hypothetical protein